MSSFNSKKSLEIFWLKFRNNIWSKKDKGIKVPSLMPIRVKSKVKILTPDLPRPMQQQNLWEVCASLSTDFLVFATHSTIYSLSKLTYSWGEDWPLKNVVKFFSIPASGENSPAPMSSQDRAFLFAFINFNR